MITPKEFVERWAQSSLREQQGAQSHFNELCELVGYRTPAQMDPAGEFFTFEEQVGKATGGQGRADVWYKDHFAWEYKGKHRDLDAAYAQLLAYRGGLDNPPLLVVCDFLEYRIYPQWPNMSGQPFVFRNEELLNTQAQNYIRWLLESPERFREERQADLREREQLTKRLADRFAHLADLMRHHTDEAGHPKWDDLRIARFLTKIVFTLFAEDVDLIRRPFDGSIVGYLVENGKYLPEEFADEMGRLFEAMNGERVGYAARPVPYFNGGLFDDSAPGAGDGKEVLNVVEIPDAVNIIEETARSDWRRVDPTIFGTLFEGALDPSKRAQLGAHFTSEADIRLIVDPVLMEPLNRFWDQTRAEAEPLMQTFLKAETPRSQQTARDRLIELHDAMMSRLEHTRVLDPACGSGNFLYVSLRAMKDLEARVRKFFEPLGLPFRDVVTPRQLFGIEKDPFAARLAHVVTWIGYLQWRYEDEGVLHPQLPRTIPHPRQLPHPILQDKLHPDDPDRIVCDDAIMRFAVPHPHPLPNALGRGEGEGKPNALGRDEGEGTGYAHTRTTGDIWQKIKPLAREMRKDPTPAEEALWQQLRGKRMRGYRFRRQHPVDRFIVDFFCPELRLVVEVDGPIHEQQAEYDALRQAFIESLGIRVLRFTNDEVLRAMPDVLARIEAAIQSPPPNPFPMHWEGESGVGIPYEPDWPDVDVIVSNPPFLGRHKQRQELGDEYVDNLFALYEDRVSHDADFVMYWYEKARAHIEGGKAKRAGLLATNSIRGGANREVLKRIKETGDIFMAWADRPWVLEGAAVRVSMVGFDDGQESNRILDGVSAAEINTDLTTSVDVTQAKVLGENADLGFIGPQKDGPLDIPNELAQEMLSATNASGLSNADVVKPYLNGSDIVRRSRNFWVIDFGTRSESEASLYEAPFRYVKDTLKPIRESNRDRQRRDNWWRLGRSGEDYRSAVAGLERQIFTPRVAKYRVFVWVNPSTFPDSAVAVIARDDDYFFGVLHSKLHEVWSLRMGTWLGKGNDPRYTPTTTFETFPFPWPPGQEDTAHPAYAAITAAARQLHEERDAWLNPSSDLLEGPAREQLLRQLTLTNLYNALVEYRKSLPTPPPQRIGEGSGEGMTPRNGEGRRGRGDNAAQTFAPRLHELHSALDRAVCDAYGWPHDILDDEESILRNLLALNLARAGQAAAEDEDSS